MLIAQANHALHHRRHRPVPIHAANSFKVTEVNCRSAAFDGEKLRPDIDEIRQLAEIRRHRRCRILEINLAHYEATCTTVTNHRKFLLALVGEVRRYRRKMHIALLRPDYRSYKEKAEDFFFQCLYHRIHRTVREPTPSSGDTYGECVCELAKLHMFDLWRVLTVQMN